MSNNCFSNQFENGLVLEGYWWSKDVFCPLALCAKSILFANTAQCSRSGQISSFCQPRECGLMSI